MLYYTSGWTRWNQPCSQPACSIAPVGGPDEIQLPSISNALQHQWVDHRKSTITLLVDTSFPVMLPSSTVLVDKLKEIHRNHYRHALQHWGWTWGNPPDTSFIAVPVLLTGTHEIRCALPKVLETSFLTCCSLELYRPGGRAWGNPLQRAASSNGEQIRGIPPREQLPSCSNACSTSRGGWTDGIHLTPSWNQLYNTP